MRAQLRGFRVLMSFSFGAAPLQATLFLLSGALMSLTMVVPAWGAKLLIDAVQARSLHSAYVAAAVLAAMGVARLINTLYYVDLLFTVAEKAGAAIDRRLIDLMAGIPGIDRRGTQRQPSTGDSEF